MKRTHLLPLLAAGCLLWGCGSDAPAVSTADWKTITSKDGFSVKIPPTWKAFVFNTNKDVSDAKAFVADKPALKKLSDQLMNVQQGRLLVFDEEDGIGMNVTRTNNLYHDLKTEDLRDKLVAATKDSFPWVGMPEAGIAYLPNGEVVLIQGLLPQQIGEVQRVEQYSLNRKNYIFTVGFLCVKSKQDKLDKFARTIVGTFDAAK